MATQSSADLLASSIQRTILGVLLAMVWVGLGVTVPAVLGGGVPGTIAVVVLTVLFVAALVALFVEGIREGQKG
ncbi:hypothetical protein [Halorhabdus sp. BNX81]|uniref:hypothetical protein n=1 Tax=Halorhabdus sp. BNX81 TaxID=2980181 RepID=UPI0023DD1BDC|nr:hypothetical protein [Halorhabdus sp. BNX81]WEL22418.1 hypothetical protein HBNXHr_2375 [Halorhabdus sp. BNX81]